MTIIELNPSDFFAICVFALQFVGLGALAFTEARKSWAAALRGERVMWCLGMFVLVALPAIVALRAMAPSG